MDPARKKVFDLDNPSDNELILQILDEENKADCSEFEHLLQELQIDPSNIDIEDEVEIIQPISLQRIGGDETNPGTTEEIIQDQDEDDDFLHDQALQTITPKARVHWLKGTFITSKPSPPPPLPACDLIECPSPLYFFQNYIPDKLFEEAALYTNMYAIQNENKKFMPTSSNEIKKLVALHLIASVLKFPRVRLYWAQASQVSSFINTMPRDRFFSLRNNFHFVDASQKPQGHPDRIWKVRPLFDAIRSRCLQLPLESELCIDEQMVPFTGKLDIKQYVKGKPCPWGVKIFFLCGTSGAAYDFLVYQGSTTNIDPALKNELGLGASVVYTLSKRIQGYGYKLFYDNYFSSYGLLQMLKNDGIFTAGTIRINRFAKPPVSTDKQLKKKVRGHSEEVISKDGIIVVKWKDSRTVVLASNFVGIGDEDMVKRWDKELKRYVLIKRPEIIKLYNKAMGGVDLLDQQISAYRSFIRSKKWTLRMVFHAFDLAVVLSHFEYKKMAKELKVPKNKILDLMAFKMQLAEDMLKVDQLVGKKRKVGRPSTAQSNDDASPPPKYHKAGERRPSKEIRLDNVDHLPLFDSSQNSTRCKCPGCTKKTFVVCHKCNVHLCLLKERNYFFEYHTNRA